MHIYSKNNLAKFHPDPIWNDGALGFFEDCRLNKKNKNNKMISDVVSVPDPEVLEDLLFAIMCINDDDSDNDW